MTRILMLIAIFALTVFGADVTGEWKASAEGPNGTMTRTFSFKVDGAKLTGETTSSLLGKSTITEGKVDGDNLSFVIIATFNGNEMKLIYKGKVVSKDEIRFTSELPQGQTIEWVAKRVS